MNQRMHLARFLFLSCVLTLAGVAVGQDPRPAPSPGKLGEALAMFDRLMNDGLFTTSGNAAIDQVIATEELLITRRFDCSPDFYYFDEPSGFNAMWVPRSRPRARALDPAVEQLIRPERNKIGTVVVGRKLAAKFCGAPAAEEPRNRNARIHGILAHEIGHMVQFLRRTTLWPTHQELLSDFLAGWSVQYEKRHGWPDIKESEVFSAFYDLGDDDEFRIEHHGTKEERLAAFLAGFKVTDDEIDAVYNQGFAFVQKLKLKPVLTQELRSIALGVDYCAETNPDGSFRMVLTRFPTLDSAAGHAGLEQGDVIVAINAKPLRTVADCESLHGKTQVRIVDVRTRVEHDLELDLP